MSNFETNNARDPWTYDMPPSYDAATRYWKASQAKETEIDSFKREIQRLNRIIQRKHGLLKSSYTQIRNYKISIFVLILLLIACVYALIVISFFTDLYF